MANKSIVNAFVPEDEQPYKVPNNWVWVRFEAVVDYEQPTDYIVESTDYDDSYNTPVLTAGKSFIIGYTNETFGIYEKIPVIIFDDFTTDTKYVDFPFKVKSSAMKILFPITDTTIEYIYFYMQTVDCNHSNHKRFWISKYSLLPFPLPPLPEQKRIVERIERMFDKLDRAKEFAQKALDGFETRKALYIEMAIRCQLTKKWREMNPEIRSSDEIVKHTKKSYKSESNNINEFSIPKSWIWVRLGDVIDLLTDYHANGSYETLKKHVTLLDIPDYSYMIRTTNFEKNDFNTLMKYITKDAYDFMNKSKLFGGEILINKIGNAGSVYYMPHLNHPASLAMNLFLLRIIKNVDSRYIYYHLCSSFSTKDIKQYVKGVTTKSIDKKSINSIKIALPPLQEQQEIVRILDCLFEKEKRARELCGVIEKIDLMKKAILARAFRGELGTNVAGEERVRVGDGLARSVS